MAYKNPNNAIPSDPPFDYDKQNSFLVKDPQLDTELDHIERALDETQDRLQLIQRSDGALRNQSVHPEALNPAVNAHIEQTAEAHVVPLVDQAEAARDTAEEHRDDAQSAQTAAELARDTAQNHRDKAEQWAENPEDVEVEPGQFSAKHHAAKTSADATQTGLDRVQTGEDRVQTGLDRQATEADAVATDADRVQTGLDADATAADRVQTGLDRTQTGEDRVQTGLDRTQTGEDAVATAADRVQTGLDRTQTGEDAVATAADRVQTGLDRTKAGEWAEKAEDVEVEPGQFSAKHHAIKAAASAAVASDPVATHVAEADPHPQYATGGAQDTHSGRTDNPHAVSAAQVGADPEGTAAGAVSTHEGAANPHPQYATGGAQDSHSGRTDNPHAVTAAQAGADPAGTAAGAVSTHEAAANPHPQYATGGAQDTHSGRTDNPHGVTAAQVGLSDVSQAEAEAGTATTRRAWTAQRVRQAAQRTVLVPIKDLNSATDASPGDAVVLLCPYELGNHRVMGRMLTARSSGNRDLVIIDFGYSANSGGTLAPDVYLEQASGTQGKRNEWDFVTCVYGGTTYAALRKNPVQYTVSDAFFIGSTTWDNALALQALPVSDVSSVSALSATGSRKDFTGLVTTRSTSLAKGFKNITISSAAPSGGADGDIWLQY